MKNLSESVTVGLAIFSMFFGAGNIIFPLALGQYAQDQSLIAFLGLFLTAVAMPIMGVIAMILFNGDYSGFFGRLGKKPGFILALLVIALLGPLGSTPRCIALSYSTLSMAGLKMPLLLFNALACLLIFACTLNKKRILPLLGYFLTPLLLVSLIAVIFLGLFHAPTPQCLDSPPLQVFLHGLKEGYNTMDLLAAFFFSSAILSLLRLNRKQEEIDRGSHLTVALRSSVIGALLLGLIYLGFCFLAACQGASLQGSKKEELLALVTMQSAGPYAGLLMNAIVVLACLTTAIALITSFTDFIQKELFKNRFNYTPLLAAALLLTFIVSSFEFSGISAFLGPLLQLLYPSLIALTILNILFRTNNFKIVKTPVAVVFIITIAYMILT